MLLSSLPRPALPKIPVRLPAWAQNLYEHMTRLEKLAIGWLSLIFIVSAIWSIAVFLSTHTALIPQTGGTYREAAVGQPRYLNPILSGASDLDVDISRLIYSSLFKFDNNLQLQPDLAESFEIKEDNTKYIVRLRSDVRWHDGEPFTADDVVFTIASIETPDYGSPLQNSFQGVVAEKIDDRTVSFKLKGPYAPFLASLTVGIVPQHVWSGIVPKNAALAEQMLKPVGTGPYKFSELKTRRKTGEITEYNLVRNDAYYGTRPLIDAIAFNFYNSHDEAVKAFLAGRTDGLGFLPLQLRNQVARRSSFTIHRLRLPQYYSVFFNLQKDSVLADNGVRNALELATDRQTLVKDALQNEGEPLHLPIPPGVFAFNDEISAPTFDPERAKQNLEEAGWRDADNDGIREKDGRKLHFAITTTDWPEYMQTAELLKEQWRNIGVSVDIERYGAGTIQQTIIRPRSYEALLFGEILPAEPDPYSFWHSTQSRSPGLNFSLLKNDQVDKLLEEARKTLNPDERRVKYKQFQGLILDIKPAIILYRPYYLFAGSENVRGISAEQAAIPSGRFSNIEQWHVKVKRIWKNQ